MGKKQTFEDDGGDLETLRRELRETQVNLQRLESIVDSSPAVVFLWRMTAGWPVEFVSQSITQFGYTAEELMSGEVAWPTITYAEDVPRLEAEVRDYLAGGASQFDQEYRLVTKSGDVRWVEDRNMVIRNTDGQITHIQGMIVDITKRKRMETALRDSETSLNEAQKLAGVGSWQWDLRTGRTVMSEELLRIYGLPPDTPPEDVENVVDSLIHPDDRAKMRDLMARILGGSKGESISFRVIRPNGEVRWLEATKYTVHRRADNGDPLVIMGAIQDITEQRAARIALQQSEEKYRAVVESAGEAICTLNAEGKFLFMNTICAQRLGGTRDELVGKTLWDVFPKEFADGEAVRARAAINSDKSSLIETIVPLGDEMRWYQISMEPVRDHDGETRLALVFARDITDRKRAEEGLRQSEQRYRTLFEGANEGILVADIDTRKLMFGNPAVRRMLNYSAEELLEMTVEDCHRPEDMAHAMGEFQALARGDRQMALTVPFLTRNGEVVYADVGATIIRLEGKNCMVGFLRDLTDARRAEEALKTAHTKLVAARDEERKHLAAELHDSVSQKLIALGIQLDNVSRQSDRNPDSSQLPDAAKTCNELIEDIRRICRGLYPPALEALGLISAMQPLEEHCRKAGFNAAIRCDPILRMARFSPEIEIALFRISQEAVNNAIRHGGGTNIDIDIMYIDEQLVLAVVDDGAGFDVSAAEGMGFGLSSMQDRARAVGARLTIASEPGETRVEVSTAVNIEETDEKKGQ
ncbi:MAG: PAS domain S-box protein [Phycisphaerae bacterium]|jgi:PAS domain S-box-containing protein|nr:PAS domain S-box protein [Phycisphaerae bacterium]